MKRILFALVLIMPALFSCEKENGKEGGKDADPADKFVGTYTYVWNYYEKWFGEEKNDVQKGTFDLVKDGTNSLKMVGDFTTAGLVSGNMLNFASFTVDNETVFLTYAFGPAKLTGDDLTFYLSASGKKSKNGAPQSSYLKKGDLVATKKR